MTAVTEVRATLRRFWGVAATGAMIIELVIADCVKRITDRPPRRAAEVARAGRALRRPEDKTFGVFEAGERAARQYLKSE